MSEIKKRQDEMRSKMDAKRLRVLQASMKRAKKYLPKSNRRSELKSWERFRRMAIAHILTLHGIIAEQQDELNRLRPQPILPLEYPKSTMGRVKAMQCAVIRQK